MTFTVAAVQATPVVLERERTIDKACALIDEASHAGARLIVFPETFVPAYPDWLWALPPGNQQLIGSLYAELVDQSVEVPSAATRRLGEAARAAKAYLVMGCNERNSNGSNASLYNTLLYFSPEGRLLGKHRKLMPTGAERLVWAQGDGSTLDVFDTPLGRLGGLTCWENYMPLARYTLFAAGIQLYVAPTWDRGDMWQATLRHIAKEGGTYVIGCGMPMRVADLPERLGLSAAYEPDRDWINGGDSTIVNPDGDVIAGPLHKAEGILYAEVDAARTRSSKWMFDVAGHYARPDVFELTVRRDERHFLRSEGAAPARNPQQLDLVDAARHDDVGDQDVTDAFVRDRHNVALIESGVGSVAPADG